MRSVFLSPQAFNHTSVGETIRALELASSLHFNAIKLWFDPIDYNYTTYNSSYLNAIFSAADGLELALFISTIQNWEYNEQIGSFPYNDTEIGWYSAWLSWVVSAGNGHPSVAVYNFYCLSFVRSSVDLALGSRLKGVYRNFTAIVHLGDPDARVTLFADPIWTYIPLPRAEYDALGFQPYSWIKDTIQRDKVLNFYHAASNLHPCVFVDEVGFRTFDTTGRPELATCSSEAAKHELIMEYRRLFEKELHVGWSYFMLFDRANGVEDDFGLIDYNETYRLSSQAFLIGL
jgi:hypothetical protein